MDNYGLIIRHLRKLSKLNVRQAADKIQRSIGWLSEIENSRGTARLTEREFNRIVELLDGNHHKPMFKTWISTQKRSEQSERAFDGAVLKYIRMKKELNLKEASRLSGLSMPQLSKFETGHKLVSLETRNRVMLAYGYSPSSFKNLSTDRIRSRAVPFSFKLEILLKNLPENQIEKVFCFAQGLLDSSQNGDGPNARPSPIKTTETSVKLELNDELRN